MKPSETTTSPTAQRGSGAQGSSAKAGGAIPAPITARLKELGIAQPMELIRSGTKIDGGRWFVGSPLWVAALPDRLVLLAEGPRKFVLQIPYSDLSTSFYSEVSGELVCVPGPQLVEVRSLRMTPEQAKKLLAIMGRTGASIA